MNKQLDNFTEHYLIVALWSSLDDNGDPLDANYSIQDIAPIALIAAQKECEAFRATAKELLAGWPDEQAAHDFWLTRCGHGAGFWDRKEFPNGDLLTALVGFKTAFPPLDLYIGDDGLVYGFGE